MVAGKRGIEECDRDFRPVKDGLSLVLDYYLKKSSESGSYDVEGEGASELA